MSIPDDFIAWIAPLAISSLLANTASNGSPEDNQLVITGAPAEGDTRTYLHKGIGARAFQRRFILADGIEIAEARLENGLLVIDLVRPDTKPRIQTIPISGS